MLAPSSEVDSRKRVATCIGESAVAPSSHWLGKSTPARTLHIDTHFLYKNPTTTSPFKNSPDSVIGSVNVSEKSIECYRPVFLWKLCSGAHCRYHRRRRSLLRRSSISVFTLALSVKNISNQKIQ